MAEQQVEVLLYVKKNKFPDIDSLARHYGLQIPQGLHVKTLPSLLRFSPILIALFMCLKTIFNHQGTSFYLRDSTLARRIIQLKWFHRTPVFSETHSVPRIYDKHVTLANKEHPERAKAKCTEFIHKKSDGLICAFKETEEFLLNDHVRMPIICAWFGTEPNEGFNYDFNSRKGVYYMGSFSRSHSPELLIEAMKYIRDEKLILIGGYNEQEISHAKDFAERTGVADRIVFKDYVPPAEVSNHLKQARVVISLWAGLKLTDYFTHGLPIVSCNYPGKDVLRDNDNCILFQPKDPKSLADSINKILTDPALAETLARNAYETAQEYRWQKRAERIINFIESNAGSEQ